MRQVSIMPPFGCRKRYTGIAFEDTINNFTYDLHYRVQKVDIGLGRELGRTANACNIVSFPKVWNTGDYGSIRWKFVL